MKKPLTLFIAVALIANVLLSANAGNVQNDSKPERTVRIDDQLQVTQGLDPLLVNELVRKVDVQSGANYQLLLWSLYKAFNTRYDGIDIVDFDRESAKWGWKKLRDTPQGSGFISYLIQKAVYSPSPEYPHDLQFELFVSQKNEKFVIDGITPVLHVEIDKPFSSLREMGYPPDSVLGKLIKTDSYKNETTKFKRVMSIDVSYHSIRYVSDPSLMPGFSIDTSVKDLKTQETRNLTYSVISGLEYYTGAPSPIEYYHSENTLISPHDLLGPGTGIFRKD